MALQPTSGENQVFYNDVTKQYHLVNIDPADGTETDLGVISQADALAALASLETQVDLTTVAVDLTTAAVVLNTTSVDLVTTAVDLVTTAVDLTTTSTDLISTNLLARNPIDAVTGARVAVQSSHHEVHEGCAFTVHDRLNISTATQKWLVVTPNSLKFAHMIFSAVATGEISITVTEGATHTGTTGLTEVARRRVVESPAIAATLTAFRGVDTVSPATSDGITEILAERSGATGQGNKTMEAGTGRGENEYILAPNTKYTVAIQTFADVWVTLILDWYEHTDVA